VVVAKAAYKYSGAQDVVSCVTHPQLSSCIKAAVTVALVVGTGGEGEAEVAAMKAAEEGGSAVAEQVGKNKLADFAESCAIGGESFTAGTKVLLANGKAVPISSLKPGEKVLATSTRTGKTRAETIAAVLVHHDTNLYDLTVRANGRTAVIDTTSNHPFWDATTRRWVKAAGLKYGTHLRTPYGTTATVVGGYTPEVTVGWMWDLTIPGDHDFYIDTTAAPILVHNCSKRRGVYEFADQANLGMTYVGKTLNFARRLQDHIDSGRLGSLADATCTHVCGSEGDVFVAESQRIAELEAQGVSLSNKIASPGKAIANARRYVQGTLW
jgi:hypothetical protein